MSAGPFGSTVSTEVAWRAANDAARLTGTGASTAATGRPATTERHDERRHLPGPHTGERTGPCLRAGERGTAAATGGGRRAAGHTPRGAERDRRCGRAHRRHLRPACPARSRPGTRRGPRGRYG